MRTTIATILTASCLLLGACSQNAQQTQPSSNEAPTTSSTQTTAPAAENTESSNQSQIIKHQGKIVGEKFDTYHFDGKKGQQVKITITGKGNAEAFLYGYDDFMTGEYYTLPETAQYEVRVAQPRNFARRGDTSTYDLTIDLK